MSTSALAAILAPSWKYPPAGIAVLTVAKRTSNPSPPGSRQPSPQADLSVAALAIF